jgi:hypothetical protein
MDTLTSDSSGQPALTASIQVIGWWGLFDTDEVWEWGRAFMTNMYRQPFTARSSVSEAFLRQSANQ